MSAAEFPLSAELTTHCQFLDAVVFPITTAHPESYEIRTASWQLILLILAGWINHQEQGRDRIPSGRESRASETKLGKKRILLNDDQRRRLAVKRQILRTEDGLEQMPIVTPGTILRWQPECGGKMGL